MEDRVTQKLELLNDLGLQNDCPILSVIFPIKSKSCYSNMFIRVVLILRIALEIQSNRRVFLLDNVFTDFDPDDFATVGREMMMTMMMTMMMAIMAMMMNRSLPI